MMQFLSIMFEYESQTDQESDKHKAKVIESIVGFIGNLNEMFCI